MSNLWVEERSASLLPVQTALVYCLLADMDVAVWALGNVLTPACPRPAHPPHSRAAYAKRRNVVLILMLSGSIVLSIIYHLNGEC